MLTTMEILSHTLCIYSQSLKAAVLCGHCYSNYAISEHSF